MRSHVVCTDDDSLAWLKDVSTCLQDDVAFKRSLGQVVRQEQRGSRRKVLHRPMMRRFWSTWMHCSLVGPLIQHPVDTSWSESSWHKAMRVQTWNGRMTRNNWHHLLRCHRYDLLFLPLRPVAKTRLHLLYKLERRDSRGVNVSEWNRQIWVRKRRTGQWMFDKTTG